MPEHLIDVSKGHLLAFFHDGFAARGLILGSHTDLSTIEVRLETVSAVAQGAQLSIEGYQGGCGIANLMQIPNGYALTLSIPVSHVDLRTVGR